MTDSNGKIIKTITQAAAGSSSYYMVNYKDGSCRTYTRATGEITKWLENNNKVETWARAEQLTENNYGRDKRKS